MKLAYILFFVIFLPISGYNQQVTLVTPLQSSLDETSGLIYLNQKLITHNDSGGKPFLYELDSVSGNVSRIVVVGNATNIDWEDLCYDDTYIYIADFGNNNGSRTNLKVYRILISDYFTSVNDTVTADTIHFSYSDQTDFTSSQYSTNFDAEALISYNDSLYIFTKNWGNNRTNIYALPKMPGTYQINKIDSINSQGLVTGAAFNSLSNTIVLSGYTALAPFAIEISNFNINELSSGTINRYLLQMPSGFSYQVESITAVNQNQYYLTAEKSFAGSSGLFKLTSNLLGLEPIEETTATIFPNPASNVIHINCNDLSIVEIYDSKGALKKTSSNKQIYISDFSKGVYFIRITTDKGVVVKKIIIK